MKKKSQASLEFLTILGISLTLIAILSAIFIGYSNSAKQGLDKEQIENIGEELISNIERIYFQGNGNRVTQRSNFPSNILNFTIFHRNVTLSGVPTMIDYINITYNDDGFLNDLIFYPLETFIRIQCDKCYTTPPNALGEYVSYFNTSDFSQGPKQIRVESRNQRVYISFTN